MTIRTSLFEQQQMALAMDEGSPGVPDIEVLEACLSCWIPARRVQPVANALMKHFGSYANVLAADSTTLRQLPQVNERVIQCLKAVHVAARRLALNEVRQQTVISSWDKVIGYLNVTMARDRREQCRLLCLDRKNNLLQDVQVHRGTIDQTPLYPREVIKIALDNDASAIILTHNHPSGNPTPSQQDIDSTRELKKGCEALGLALHDHIIIAKSDYFSFRATGLL